MMRLAVALGVLATGAAAQEGCTKTELGQFIAATERAALLTRAATAAIGPNDVYTRWFGPYDAKRGEVVRQRLKAIDKALRSGSVTASCKNNGQGLCDAETYAFIDKDTPYLVNLCPNFFEMDTMKMLTQATTEHGTGTRAGTMIHEVSHFTIVSDTEDHCYTRTECSAMAARDPNHAIENADSYQYFVEDAAFFGLTGATGAPQ